MFVATSLLAILWTVFHEGSLSQESEVPGSDPEAPSGNEGCH